MLVLSRENQISPRRFTGGLEPFNGAARLFPDPIAVLPTKKMFMAKGEELCRLLTLLTPCTPGRANIDRPGVEFI